MPQALPRIIAIVGATASGKTALGIAIARAVDGEVIACDSRTIYQGMDIGTAKPKGDRITAAMTGNLAALAGPPTFLVEGVVHWGFDLVAPDQAFSAADFQAFADKTIADIVKRGKVPILVGGTGFYLSAILDRVSLAHVPPNPELRAAMAMQSNEELLEEIAKRDPDAASVIDAKNRRRLERALEVIIGTGGTFAAARREESPRYEALRLGVAVEREELFERINARVDAMVAEGLIDEVRRLFTRYGPDAPGMSGIGYRQLTESFLGKVSLREAVLQVKQDSRDYARRQETWFKRDERIVWIKNISDAIDRATSFIGHVGDV
ncbi:tRNA (adenosine(37)-N6)-dimethylallyltransferase MiaA [Patescibacteria group bacterium]|nr:tRNA (adenosine(37)-N6)-dimethylallyltransferase MiaA [Patescibacteria group bacterium]